MINNGAQPISAESAAERMTQAKNSLLGNVSGTTPSSTGVVQDAPVEEEVESEAWNADSATFSLDSIEGETGNQADASSSPEGDTKKAALSQDKETAGDSSNKKDIAEIMVTDAKGRRKVQVDYSDKESINKYIQLAAGARRWQAQRDEVKKNLDSVTAEYKGLQSDWNKFEEAYKTAGVKGLVNLLEGRSDAFDSFIQKEMERVQTYQEMTPSERADYDRREYAEKQTAENRKLKEEYEKKLQEITARQEAAEEKALESKLHPSFDRYRFKGKLNDEVAETEFDEALWNRALSRLEQVPDGTDITQALIDKTFRAVSESFKKHIHGQVEKGVKVAIDGKKESATMRVQAKASKGLRPATAEVEQFKQATKSGDTAGALRAFLSAGGKLF